VPQAENVVFTDAYANIVKLTDFGMSAKLSPGNNDLLTTMCGSLLYSAPEVLLQEPYIGPLADLWSLGVVLFLMVAGALPFDDRREAVAVTKALDVQ
jgi:SNF-related kinase